MIERIGAREDSALLIATTPRTHEFGATLRALEAFHDAPGLPLSPTEFDREFLIQCA